MSKDENQIDDLQNADLLAEEELEVENQENIEEEKKEKKQKIWTYILIALMVLIVMMFFYFSYRGALNKQSAEKREGITTITELATKEGEAIEVSEEYISSTNNNADKKENANANTSNVSEQAKASIDNQAKANTSNVSEQAKETKKEEKKIKVVPRLEYAESFDSKLLEAYKIAYSIDDVKKVIEKKLEEKASRIAYTLEVFEKNKELADLEEDTRQEILEKKMEKNVAEFLKLRDMRDFLDSQEKKSEKKKEPTELEKKVSKIVGKDVRF